MTSLGLHIRKLLYAFHTYKFVFNEILVIYVSNSIKLIPISNFCDS